MNLRRREGQALPRSLCSFHENLSGAEKDQNAALDLSQKMDGEQRAFDAVFGWKQVRKRFVGLDVNKRIEDLKNFKGSGADKIITHSISFQNSPIGKLKDKGQYFEKRNSDFDASIKYRQYSEGLQKFDVPIRVVDDSELLNKKRSLAIRTQ
jgi:hypothetical protein